MLLATDLAAARGIDVPDLEIYQFMYQATKPRVRNLLHRKVRTARMKAEGTAFILYNEKKDCRIFAKGMQIEKT